MDSGKSHSCAITNPQSFQDDDNNAVRCWGENTRGQLGYGDNENIGDDDDEIYFTAPIDFGTGVLRES